MNLGKRILSAFVEVPEDQQPRAPQSAPETRINTVQLTTPAVAAPDSGKFRNHFTQLFADANLPGPDYHEFGRMVEAMQAIPDEGARYQAAFAGLQVQGLDKQKLLETARQYLALIDNDAGRFETTLADALKEKVQDRREEAEVKSRRIQELAQEITVLQERITQLQTEIRENEEKLQANSMAYRAASEQEKARILEDVEKITRYIA